MDCIGLARGQYIKVVRGNELNEQNYKPLPLHVNLSKEDTLYHFRITYKCHNFFQLDMMRFFQTSTSNTPQSVSKNATKTINRSSGSYFNAGESTFTQTQHLMSHPDKEDQTKSINVSILILGVVCIVLFVLYVSSYAIKSKRNPFNSLTIEIEESLNWIEIVKTYRKKYQCYFISNLPNLEPGNFK